MTRVALCISGKIGNALGKSGYHASDPRILIKGHEHYQRHIISKNNVDVFIHCWDTELEEQVLQLYSPKKHKIEEQIYFDIPSHVKSGDSDNRRANNHYSRWYSNKIANDLRAEYEKENNFKYDIVMTTRFDLAFEVDIDFSKYDTEGFYAGKWSVVLDAAGNDLFKGGRGPLYDLLQSNHPIIPHLKREVKGYPLNEEGFLDLWFFTNSDNSTKFFSLYDHLNEYTKPGNCDLDSNGTISNHRLVRHHLDQTGLMKNLKFEFHMFDDFPEVRRKYFGCKK